MLRSLSGSSPQELNSGSHTSKEMKMSNVIKVSPLLGSVLMSLLNTLPHSLGTTYALDSVQSTLTFSFQCERPVTPGGRVMDGLNGCLLILLLGILLLMREIM